MPCLELFECALFPEASATVSLAQPTRCQTTPGIRPSKSMAQSMPTSRTPLGQRIGREMSRVMLLPLHSVLTLNIQFCQERVLQFLTWQEETFPADPSVHAPQNFTKRNGSIWCNGKSESLTHCLKVSLFQGPMQMQIPWAGMIMSCCDHGCFHFPRSVD